MYMTPVFRFAQGLTGNPLLDSLMVLIAEFAAFLVPLALVYLWFQGKEGRKTSLYAFTAVVAGLVFSYAVLGQVYGHQSPYQRFDTIASGEPENSFPSQHTAVVLSMVIPLLWRKREKLGYLLLGAGVATGFARIYVGEHYLVDILGSAVAALLGFGVIYLLEKYLDDEVEEMAGFGHRIEQKVLDPLKSLAK